MTPLTASGNFSCHPNFKQGWTKKEKVTWILIKPAKHIPTSLGYKFVPNINTIYHYFAEAGHLLDITIEAKSDLTHLGPIMWMGWAGKYNKGRTNILKLLGNDT